MRENPADSTAETKPTVVPGMGYPNDRVEQSPEPIGWQGLAQEDIVQISLVSRETSGEK